MFGSLKKNSTFVPGNSKFHTKKIIKTMINSSFSWWWRDSRLTIVRR